LCWLLNSGSFQWAMRAVIVLMIFWACPAEGRRTRTRITDSKKGNSTLPARGPKKLKPFQRGRPSIVIDKAVEQTLARGEVWQSLQVEKGAATGQAVMDVDASPSVVWHQLTTFDSYTDKVPQVCTCEIYKRGFKATASSQVEQISVKYASKVFPGIKLTYHVEHTFDPAKSSITWTLDDEQINDIDEVEGHWHVEPHPSDSSKARLFYEVGLVAPGWLPSQAMDFFTKMSITDATSWVVRESELDAAVAAHARFTPGKPLIEMNKTVERVLAQGRPWQKTQLIGNTAFSQVVMDVDASPTTVWNEVLDFASYPKKVPKVITCKVYARSVEGSLASKYWQWLMGGNVEKIFVRYVTSLFPGHKVSYHVAHTYKPAMNSITWTLDADQENGIEDLHGHWHVEPHPIISSKSRTYFEFRIAIPRRLPRRLVRNLANRAVKDSTLWVKRESELKARGCRRFVFRVRRGGIRSFVYIVAAGPVVTRIFATRAR